VAKKKANSVDKYVGNQVRVRRMTLGMSQGDLAKRLGLTFQQVQKYEKGANRIGAGRLFDLARILDVEVVYFYDGLLEPLSGRPGFAEDPAPPPKPPAHTAENTQLLVAFGRIQDPKVRKHVLELVRALADDQRAE
jgi:transcriptional regulator with XRE-family HTH domain